MKQVKVIEPDGRKKKATLKCQKCDMEYNHRDYRILKDLKKLVYFNVKFEDANEITPVCHCCLRNVALELNDNQPTEVTIVSKKKPERHTFYADSRTIQGEA